MAGLLGNSWDDPQSAAIMALAGGLLRRDFGAGLTGANQAYAQHGEQKLKRGLLEAQMAETMAQAEERKLNAAKAQAEQQRQAGIRTAMPNLFRQPGLTGGQPVPQETGGVPMFSQPMGAAPMQQSPGGFDVQQALRLGMSPDEITKYAGLSNLGKPKVARTVEVMRNGKPTLIQLDESGQEVGGGFDQWKAPVMQNLGGRTAAIDPVSLAERGSFAQGMSPEGRDASARGWQSLALQRDQSNAGKAPAGYRPSADGKGLEFIPGGPADPNAAKKAAPTEFQGKAAMFGDRASEADRIIAGLDYSPSAINAKKSLGDVWGVGGALEAGGNLMLPATEQKAEQAERDFINAVLRLESGAAIGKDEFANARKQYFPQPFDSAEVKLQKAANRKRAIQGLQSNARTSAPAAPVNTGGASGSFGDDNDPLGLRK